MSSISPELFIYFAFSLETLLWFIVFFFLQNICFFFVALNLFICCVVVNEWFMDRECAGLAVIEIYILYSFFVSTNWNKKWYSITYQIAIAWKWMQKQCERWQIESKLLSLFLEMFHSTTFTMHIKKILTHPYSNCFRLIIHYFSVLSSIHWSQIHYQKPENARNEV